MLDDRTCKFGLHHMPRARIPTVGYKKWQPKGTTLLRIAALVSVSTRNHPTSKRRFWQADSMETRATASRLRRSLRAFIEGERPWWCSRLLGKQVLRKRSRARDRVDSAVV